MDSTVNTKKVKRKNKDCFKISNVSGKRRDVVPKTLVNGDGGMEDEDDEDEDSDSDEESVWDMSIHLNALAESETEGKDGTSPILNHAPLVNFSGHKDEGYAIDWSPATAGRLLSGDCMSMIHLWEPASGSWTVDPIPLAGHTASVEDIQWSPSEAKWGSRLDYLSRHITQMLASCMLASGSDDGTFSIHDLRVIKDGDKDKVAHFEYHKHPITSIEWSAHESSTLAVSSGDNQLTIWDLSLEKDEEEEAEFKAQTKEQVNTPQDLPPQLLFVHQGQKDLKELHWHNQIPGMIVSTAADGFNVDSLLRNQQLPKAKLIHGN
ncbi:hypothetical protein Bca101_074625 [Brassica carinata]